MQAASEHDVVQAVRSARETGASLEILGHGTKRAYGRPPSGGMLDLAALRGIVCYEPEELIVTARPGTSVAELNAVLSEKGQRLGFEPPEWAALFGCDGNATLGGVVSADACGAARVRYGGPRDQLLGIRAVNGFGEAFKAGGRVVKNVTGFDIPKLVCGAFGTLCVLTELTFRVYPKPPLSAVLAVCDLPPALGLKLLRRAWSSPLEPTGLAYVPGEGLENGQAFVRLDGAHAPLNEKIAHLRDLLSHADVDIVEDGERIFAAIANGSTFAGSEADIWRVHVAPARAAALIALIAPKQWYADWAGGLLWIATTREEGDYRELRLAAEGAGGHAILMRASKAARMHSAVFPAEIAERATLTRAVKAAFDPLALLNRGRMYEGV